MGAMASELKGVEIEPLLRKPPRQAGLPGGIDHGGRTASVDIEIVKGGKIGGSGFLHMAGAPSPAIFGARQHGDVFQVLRLAQPAANQLLQVKIAGNSGAPIQVHQPPLPLHQGILDNALDRRKPCPCGEEEQGARRIPAQREIAQRRLDAQDVFFLHTAEDVAGKFSALDPADVQFDEPGRVRRIGNGKTALAAITQEDVEILPGNELQTFGSGQLEVKTHHVMRQQFHLFHPARQSLHHDLLRGFACTRCDGDIAQWPRLTEQSQARADFLLAQGIGRAGAVIDPAFQNLALARTALTIAATVGQRHRLADRRRDDVFAFLDGEIAPAGLDAHFESHGMILICYVERYSTSENGMNHAFIIGCGDIGRRVAALWKAHGTVSALARTPQSAQRLADNGIKPIEGDLDQPTSLRNLPVKDALLFYFAPPPGEGDTDPRLRSMLAALTPENLPERIVYISTTGVYGDCQGAWITEETAAHPRSTRGARRLDAENTLRDWQNSSGAPVVILRVPGIYGPGRLPADRLRQGVPVVCEEESPFSNRIHAADLARVCIAAAQQGRGGEVYNVSDGHPTSMTDYFYRVADLLALPHPPVVSMAEARRRLSPGMLSFLEESKRIDNCKMLRELGVELLYPTLEAGLTACLADEGATGHS